MDRGRESRRGGGGSGAVSGHHASSRRRPRSGFKDSAVVCEEDEGLNESPDSTRLRERSSSNNNNNSNSKKERSGLSSSRNKRKRPGLHERFHGSSRDRDRDHDGADESSEESAGEEDEEEDDEPPRPPPNPRKATKFKSQCKVSDDMIGVGLISVPRKARSAAMKRGHDSSPVSVTATTITTTAAADGGGHQRQKSPSPARPSAIPASPSSSNASVKPGRRMKPIGTKPRPSKMTKVSNTISDREVEVAEVLFGLTRQFQNHHHHSAAAAAESYANDASAAAPDISKVSSPVMPAPASSSVVSSPPNSSPISPPSSSAALSLPQQSASIPAPAMAPKRKRPRPAKPEEASPAVAMRPPAPLGGVSVSHTTINSVTVTRNDVELGTQVTKMEILSSKMEPNAAFSGKGIPLVASTTSAASPTCVNFNPISCPPSLTNQSDAPIVTEKTVETNIADSKPTANERIIEAKVADLKIASEKIPGNKTAEVKMICEKMGGAKSADLKSAASEKTVGTNMAEYMSTPAPSAEKKPSGVSKDLDKMMPEVSEAPVEQNAKEEIDSATSHLPFGPDLKVEAVKTLYQSPKIENTFEEKFKIDLMAPPGKLSLDTEDDSVPDAVGTTSSEAPEKGTVETTNISEAKAVAVKEEREPDKREEVKLEETEKKHEKRGNGEEKGLEKHSVKERNIDLQSEGEKLEKDWSNPLAQKQSKIPRNESRVEKPEKSATAAMGNATTSSNVVASMPIPWPGGLHALGRYFGPANWHGAPSIPGVVPIEGANTTPAIQPAYFLQQSRQTWKRCATHSYIAHFIECQQRMVPHPFWHAANYGNPVAVYGGKPYNLNMPLPPPPEIISLGVSLPGTVSVANTGNSGSIGNNLDSLQDRNIGSAAFGAFNSQSTKAKIAPSSMDARRKHPSHQQAAQQSTSTIIQQGPPGFGFPTTQSGAGGANSSTACNTGNASSLGNAVGLGTAPSAGTGGGNSTLTSICAEPPYMAMIQQNGYPFTINTHGHFGTTFNATSNHIGQQQAAQFFNSPPPFYATQLLHPPQPQLQLQPQPQTQLQPQAQSQQHGSQNPSTSSGSSSSQKHQQHLQGSCNFSSSQKQQHQGTPSPSPSNSQQQHHLPASQTRQIERESNNGADSPSTADSRIPPIQKNFYSQGSPSNSNFNVNPSSLLVSGGHPQDLTFIATSKQNGKQQQHPPQIQHQVAPGYTIQQHHGNDSALQMGLKGFDGQSQAQAIAALSRSPGLLMAHNHVMLQGMSESARQQMAAQVQQNAIQSGPQPQRSGQMQRTQSTSSGEGRNVTDSMSNASGRGREDEQKSSNKGGFGHPMKFSRIETENSANIHGGSLTDGGLSSSLGIESMGRTLNMITSGGNGSRSSLPIGSSSHSNPQPPSTQQSSQNTKQTAGRTKSVPNQNVLPPGASAQNTLSSYGDRTGIPSNIKFQASSPFPGQNLKQGQQSPQWKITPRTPTAVGNPSQAVLAAAMKSFPQQGRNQQGNPNIGSSPVAPSQASFITSTKSSGQPPINQQNNSGAVVAPRLTSTNSVPASAVGSLPISPQPPVSKSMNTPALRTATGNKGPISQQKSIAPVSNKKSSPVGSRSTPSVLGPSHISQSPSGKSTPQQYQQQQQQSVSLMASGQPVGLKTQQYHNQYQQQQFLFTHGQYLQQAAQQSQFSPQSANQVPALHQKQQMQGSNSPQTSFCNPHLRQQQEQQQQMQPGSSTSSNAGPLSLASPTLTLGGGSTKINPGGSLGANLHAQYSGQQQSDVLNQDQINGVPMLSNPANSCTSSAQNRNPFNASSPQASSIRMPSGSLKKAGGNMAEGMISPGGLSLSMTLSSAVRTHNSGLASNVNAMQHAKSTSVSSISGHSGQMPSISIHQPSVPLATGPVSPVTSTPPGLHGQATASVVQP